MLTNGIQWENAKKRVRRLGTGHKSFKGTKIKKTSNKINKQLTKNKMVKSQMEAMRKISKDMFF